MFNEKKVSRHAIVGSLACGGLLALGLSLTALHALPAKAATMLNNTSWQIIGFGTQTMQFNDKGNVGGSAGCNNYSASYKLGKGKGIQDFSLGPVRVTRKMCISKSVMKSERDFLKKLDSVKRIGIKGRKLQLLDVNDKVLATFLQKK